MTQVWDDMLTDTERDIIRQGGYGQPRPLGLRPAVLIIDAQVNYVGKNQPTLEQIDQYPSGVGHRAWQALPAIRELLDIARERGVQIVYTKMRQSQVQRSAQAEPLGFYDNVKRGTDFMTDDDPGQQVVSQLAPHPDLGDLVLHKDQPSAFFGTPLASYCIKWGVDTVLLAGGTTSGCVRATAVDAAGFNLHVVVVEECVYDRMDLSHKASLLDIWMKYGSVIRLRRALDYLRSLDGE